MENNFYEDNRIRPENLIIPSSGVLAFAKALFDKKNTHEQVYQFEDCSFSDIPQNVTPISTRNDDSFDIIASERGMMLF